MPNNTIATSIKKRLVVVSAIVLLSVILDQATKWIAIEYLQDKGIQSYLGDTFRLHYAENKGAFLSLFSGLSDTARAVLLVGFNGLILLSVAGFLAFKRDLHPWMVFALALIFSGGIGNLIDRIFRDGIVVDFLNIGMPQGLPQIRTGIFNVADLAIVGGLIVLLALEVFRGRQDEEPGPAPADEKA